MLRQRLLVELAQLARACRAYAVAPGRVGRVPRVCGAPDGGRVAHVVERDAPELMEVCYEILELSM